MTELVVAFVCGVVAVVLAFGGLRSRAWLDRRPGRELPLEDPRPATGTPAGGRSRAPVATTNPPAAPRVASADRPVRDSRRFGTPAERVATLLVIGAALVGGYVLFGPGGRLTSGMTAGPTEPGTTGRSRIAPITFAQGLDPATRRPVQVRQRFTTDDPDIAWSATLEGPAGVGQLTVTLSRRVAGRDEVVTRSVETTTDPTSRVVAGRGDLAAAVGNAAGVYVMRYHRGDVLLAEGAFELVPRRGDTSAGIA